MPYQVKQLLEGKGSPVCVNKDDGVAVALALMIEHDFSQLPVINVQGDFEFPVGMITYEGILRGIRNFKLQINELKVRDVMSPVKTYNDSDDLFDILDTLKNTNAVLIMDDEFPILNGIVTSYDTTEYFRNRTEDLMRVEDVEVTVKDIIREVYLSDNGELDEDRLSEGIKQVCHRGKLEKLKSFDELTMAEYINLLILPNTWDLFHGTFNLPRESVGELLHSIRIIRNSLAHFRGDITAEQRDQLKFGAEWLTRCQEEYQLRRQLEEHARLNELIKQGKVRFEKINSSQDTLPTTPETSFSEFTVTEAAAGGGRYAALADWLQSQPGRIDKVQLTLNQIEEIIDADLPASSRNHRAWWANDSVSHSHSQLWLDAGWRTTYINLSEGRVTFSRIKERERAYISFFSKLLDELRKKAKFPFREAFPDGASWIVVQTIPRSGQSFGSFTFSFSRDKRLRVELYLDLLDKAQTKAVFDKLYEMNELFAEQVGPIEWERLDNRRASRLALYKDGQITDEVHHTELQNWAVDTMIKFYNTMAKPAENAILEVKSA